MKLKGKVVVITGSSSGIGKAIAEAYIFLADNDAMTGEVIYVDAGFRLK